MQVLSVQDLRREIDPASLGFADTRSLCGEPLPWIGQARAQAAAQFGLALDQPGYNLFVVGEVGTGRTSLMREAMQAQAARRPVPPDLCYLHNLDAPEHPRALRLPAGAGRQLRQAMVQLVRRLQTEIPKRLTAPDVKAESARIEASYKQEEARAYAELSAYADERHFSLMREQDHLVFTYRDASGEPLTAGKAMGLSREQRQAIDSAEAALRSEISRFLERTRAMEHVMNEGLAALRRQRVKPWLEETLQAVCSDCGQPIEDIVKLKAFLTQVQQEVLENLPLFSPGDEDEDLRQEALQSVLSRLHVNLVVDNHDLQGAPVIVEDNPLFRPLFGSIEYASDGETLVTDFSRIRAGSLLRAHGGFLLLHLRDLMADAPVWEKLRRVVRSARLQIEEPGMIYAPIAAVSLEPEPVEVSVKIVLVASPEDYTLVQLIDPEFVRCFRCKVDFADSFAARTSGGTGHGGVCGKNLRTLGFAAFHGSGHGAADRRQPPPGARPVPPKRGVCRHRSPGHGKRGAGPGASGQRCAAAGRSGRAPVTRVPPQRTRRASAGCPGPGGTGGAFVRTHGGQRQRPERGDAG